jgi:nucleotide-binding universal stress UspA family protein
MIAVATRQSKEFPLASGSLPRQIIRKANCPVLTIPFRETEER